MKNTLPLIISAIFIATLSYSAEQKTHPPQVIQIAKSLKTLLASDDGAFLTISEPETDKIVQVAKLTENGKTRLSLMIGYYPSEEKPSKAFPAVGIKIRDSWKEEMYEPETCVQYNVPLEDARYLSYFIHKVYLKFYKSKDDYKLECECTLPLITASSKSSNTTAEIEGEKFTYTYQTITPPELLKSFDKNMIDQNSPRSTFRSLITAMKNKNWDNFNKTYWKREEFYKKLGSSSPKKEIFIKAWASVPLPAYELHYLLCYKEYKILIIEYSSTDYKAGRAREAYAMKKIDNKFYIMNQFSYDYSTFNGALSDLDFDIAKGKYKK